MDREGLATLESRLKRKDGTPIDVFLCLAPFDPKDMKAGVTATVLDITERKRAENELLETNRQLEQATALANSMAAPSRHGECRQE